MTRKNLDLSPHGIFCVDAIQTNPDGSFKGINPTLGACSTTPPPGPDPLALAVARVTYVGSPETVIPSCNMRLADEFFGRQFASAQPNAFPWASATLKVQVPPTKKIRAGFTVPTNCPDVTKIIRLNNYHGATLIPARMAIVAPGADWPPDSAQADGSYRRNVTPGGNVSLQLNVGAGASTGRAELVRGQSYEFLAEFEDDADVDVGSEGGVFVFTI